MIDLKVATSSIRAYRLYNVFKLALLILLHNSPEKQTWIVSYVWDDVWGLVSRFEAGFLVSVLGGVEGHA